MKSRACAFTAEKFTCYESSERGCIVVVKHSIALAQHFRPFPPNVLPHTPQHIAVELAVDSLAPGDEFTVNNPVNVQENNEHALGRAADRLAFLGCVEMLGSWCPSRTCRPKSRPQ